MFAGAFSVRQIGRSIVVCHNIQIGISGHHFFGNKLVQFLFRFCCCNLHKMKMTHTVASKSELALLQKPDRIQMSRTTYIVYARITYSSNFVVRDRNSQVRKTRQKMCCKCSTFLFIHLFRILFANSFAHKLLHRLLLLFCAARRKRQW